MPSLGTAGSLIAMSKSSLSRSGVQVLHFQIQFEKLKRCEQLLCSYVNKFELGSGCLSVVAFRAFLVMLLALSGTMRIFEGAIVQQFV
jgi:hypothetical protein